METTRAIEALAALAHASRLGVYRLLVQAGRAGLVSSRQEGRFVIYFADFSNMTALVGFLTDNCCGGRSCAPASRSLAAKRASK